jgi:hypothetical protein
LCGKFHAAYLVPEQPGGQGYYCHKCWKAMNSVRSSSALDQGAEGPSEPDATESPPVPPRQRRGT